MASHRDFFDAYVRAGLRPVAVYRGTKQPVGDDWNLNWSADRWRPYFQSPAYNMGLLLGDIVDVEGDTDEGNDTLARLIGGVPHPTFRSSKSTHHLFSTPDLALTRRVFGGIEFRGRLHQSVVPPSVHEDGPAYRWLVGSRFPVPPMPDALLQFYLQNRGVAQPRKPGRKSGGAKAGHTRTQCRACGAKFYVHKRRLALEVGAFSEHAVPWMCHGCREFDLRPACRRLRRRASQARPQALYGSGSGTPTSPSTPSASGAGR